MTDEQSGESGVQQGPDPIALPPTPSIMTLSEDPSPEMGLPLSASASNSTKPGWIRVLVALGLVGMTGMGLGAWQGYRTWQRWIAPVGGQDLIRVDIPSGAGSTQIGQTLEQEGVIHSLWAWRIWMRTGGREWVLQAGIYDLDPNRSLPEVASQLRSGNTVQETYTIPEGWRIDQMAEALAGRGWFSADTFRRVATTLQEEVSWIPPEAPSTEGYLFPDTYRIPLELLSESLSEEQRARGVVMQMLNQFSVTALPLYEDNQASGDPSPLSLHEWVTLGSIVEREAVLGEERRLIAGVFANRLEAGIPLGADPTVEYGLNIRQTPDRRLTFAEVGTPHPYNTYINVGLPPGPIASSGLASLAATLDPEPTEMLYFVARYDGSHVFSRTLAEHEAAQRQIIQQRQEGSP